MATRELRLKDGTKPPALVPQQNGGAINRGGNVSEARLPLAWKEKISAFIDAEALEVVFDIVRGKPRGEAKLKNQIWPTFGETIGAFNSLMRAIGVGKKAIISDASVVEAFTGAIERAVMAGTIDVEAARGIVLDARAHLKQETQGVEFSADD